MLEGANIKLSGTVSDINCMSARNILEYLLTGEFFDEAKYDEMYKQKIIAHNLKASKEQLIDDLNGVATPLQRRMMKEPLCPIWMNSMFISTIWKMRLITL